MEWQQKFSVALDFADFLAQHGQPGDARRWQESLDVVRLSLPQFELLRSFTRDMNVLCLAGAWCGDCAFQCPVFEQFARATPRIRLRFLDRDEHSDVQRELSINGGHRVPVVVFLSEDFHEVSRFGERTLAQYRQIAGEQLGSARAAGLVAAASGLREAVAQDWLDEFERVQLILRLSARLRQKHGD